MAEETQPFTQEQANRVAQKLQAFCDSLPIDEQRVVYNVLSMAATADDQDVKGLMAPTAPLLQMVGPQRQTLSGTTGFPPVRLPNMPLW